MRLTHLLIGGSEPIAAKSGCSGINKKPVWRTVHVNETGLDGDTIVDTENHGGPDQAVYLFGSVDLAFWCRTLGRSLAPGTFGENLLIEGLNTHDIRVGDRLTIGPVVVEVTWPRVPCTTLAARIGDPAFPRAFAASGHVGVYGRVLRAGDLRAPADVTLQASENAPVLASLPGYR